MTVKNQEIQAGKASARKLQKAIRNVISIETVKTTGELMKTRVTAKKEKQTNFLDRLMISSPHYGFKLNYGFEGVKKNGVSMKLKPTNHLYRSIEQTNVLNELADKISEIRAEQVAAVINF